MSGFLIFMAFLTVIAGTFVYFAPDPENGELNTKDRFILFGVLYFMILLFSLFGMAILPDEIDRTVLDLSEYEIVKSERKVFFVINERTTINEDEYFVYQNAEDTSKVKIVRSQHYNYFGGNLGTDYYLEVED